MWVRMVVCLYVSALKLCLVQRDPAIQKYAKYYKWESTSPSPTQKINQTPLDCVFRLWFRCKVTTRWSLDLGFLQKLQLCSLGKCLFVSIHFSTFIRVALKFVEHVKMKDILNSSICNLMQEFKESLLSFQNMKYMNSTKLTSKIPVKTSDKYCNQRQNMVHPHLKPTHAHKHTYTYTYCDTCNTFILTSKDNVN